VDVGSNALRFFAAEFTAPREYRVLASEWAPGEAHGPARIARRDLKTLIDTLSRLPFDGRVKELGLRADRADVILPAALVYDRAAALVRAREIRVPRVGLKEGILMDLVDGATARRSHEERTDRQVWAGALALGRRYLFDEPHGTHVASLALSLFDQLRPLHGLKGTERRILMAAGIAHDIGAHISYKKHHRHSFCLISESELPDFTPRQMLLAAHVARYHRKAEPAEAHETFAALDRAERRTVEVLASLLRIADALDREHRQNVTGVQSRVRGGAVHLTLEGEGDLLLERWALRRKAGLFEKVFDKELQIAEGGGA
jgi:exopolyphosphatase/guanosine-5'-triphosphate,3'-diphosphate pyrophosphatase